MYDKVFTFYNADKMIDDKDAEIYITEYLNIINFSNLSPYELQLKVGISVILLHNLSSSIKLCNYILLFQEL